MLPMNRESPNTLDKFFDGEEYTSKDNPVLQRTQNFRSTQLKFWRRVRNTLRKGDQEKVDQAVEDYNVEYSIAGLERLVSEYLPTVDTAKEKLDERRQQRDKILSTRVQRFVNTFSAFLSCYSQVMTIMIAVDTQFGGVAVQALSILLVVAVNKQKSEDQIEGLLANFKNAFPRLQGLRNIYPTPRMQELIAKVYTDVLSFSEMAVEYYQKPALERLWQAVAKPPEMGVKIAADGIVAELAEVKEERDYLLNQRVYRLEQRVAALTTMAEDGQKRTTAIEGKVSTIGKDLDIVQMQQNESQDLLASLRQALVPDDFSHEQHLEEYQSQLQARFRYGCGIKDIATNRLYQSWRQSDQSRTLILRGRTAQTNSPLSWLSSAAVELVESLRTEEGDSVMIAYYFCRREGMEDDHMHTALARMVYHLFKMRPAMLKDRQTYQAWVDILESTKWQKKDIKTACELFVSVLDQLDRVYLILDRPETCKAGDPGLSRILEESQRSACVLKTFVVVDKDTADRGEVESWKESARAKTLDIIDLDQ
ncbi:hypothetical protein BO94DRAFT_576761 [Aspergillus sclerotioniger CBS 115572]|uniref:Fungal STAND N-terminal Goodbye domain-containing protein n=1 Tax=Aspergillus sclerotioniger CBS 115572 TaxID=1450535 RepID=A0A317W4D1_9EURO|nr:hypothetical protein BO94DRAFT_576761 [Aspergillus sclerotioniger CBS 115572]PWY80839.1 hypothetical protein BO94DRAFT_576761 [Aspergillus sclerotioniger CBS 115572]